MPGPLPNPGARRRNAPTIPTTKLPVGGRKGRPPKVPDSYQLGKAGRDWWKWAWGTPQAAAWDAGALYGLARRAQIEDDLATLELFDEFELAELLGMEEETDALKRLAEVIGRLKRLATGSVSLMKEARELDTQYGLNPKGLLANRWTIIDPDAKKTGGKAVPTTSGKLPSNVTRLPAVDPSAAAG